MVHVVRWLQFVTAPCTRLPGVNQFLKRMVDGSKKQDQSFGGSIHIVFHPETSNV